MPHKWKWFKARFSEKDKSPYGFKCTECGKIRLLNRKDEIPDPEMIVKVLNQEPTCEEFQVYRIHSK